ncbi:hypothetical protein NQ317_002952, partial [Molorchus minor]
IIVIFIFFRYHRNVISDKFNINTYLNEIRYDFLPSQQERLFWSLPSQFTGNKIKSYGGRLEFIQKYTQRPQSRYVPDQDVIITGNGIVIYWSNPNPNGFPEDIANPVSIALHPSDHWFSADRDQGPKPASREDILKVLANIESILIRATQSSDTSAAYLSDITLDTAVERNGNSRATSVEVCRCPLGYRGSSCESCATGYYRDIYFDQSRPLGSCSKCPCNDREESCELGPDRRVICYCSQGFTGLDCSDVTMLQSYSQQYHQDHLIQIQIQLIILLPLMLPLKVHDLEYTKLAVRVRYNCSATSEIAPTIRIHWTKDGKELPPHAIDDGRGLLVITSLRVTDSGKYVCEADDGYSIATSSINISVGELRRPRIAVSPNFVDVNEGQPIEVQCAADGIPTPDLTLSRVNRQSLNPRHYFENGLFRILQSQRSDTGEYECIASNSEGTDVAIFQINVRDVPGPLIRVDIQPPNFSGIPGDDILLRCVATSIVSENVQDYDWSRVGGTPLPYNAISDRGTLTIPNSSARDSGVYICTVTSVSGTRGSHNTTITITDSQGTSPVASVDPERITISQGQSTEITCRATGSPPPSIKWTKLGDELSANSEQIGSVLYIRNAQPRDRGVYICVTTNVHGLAQASAMLEVTPLEAPRLELYPGNRQVVLEGNSALLYCRPVAGIPSPVITWTRGDNRPFGRNIEEMSGGNLRFVQVTPDEEGEYICTGTNEAGTATAVAHIIVHTLPQVQIIPSQDIITRSIGDSLTLQCLGSGTPLPNVGWSKYQDETRKIIDFGDSNRDLSHYSQ